MNGYCWVCKTSQEFNGTVSSELPMAYGFPFPILGLRVKCNSINDDDEITQFVCEDCRRGILRMIVESGIMTIENIRQNLLEKLAK